MDNHTKHIVSYINKYVHILFYVLVIFFVFSFILYVIFLWFFWYLLYLVVENTGMCPINQLFGSVDVATGGYVSFSWNFNNITHEISGFGSIPASTVS